MSGADAGSPDDASSFAGQPLDGANSFARLIQGSVDGASVATGTGSVSRSGIDRGDARTYIVNLTGVANAQTLTVSLANVNDSAGNSSASVSASVGFLLGDVNQTGAVDGNDVSAVQARTRQRAVDTNFKADVNTSGTVDGNDVSIVQGKTRNRLP